MKNDYDILIVGAGISGVTLAERFANKKNRKVLIIEKRDHIGGNCYDFYNEIGILVPKYGPHFFHTNLEHVWDYVSNFTQWHNYEHRVVADVNNKLVPVPVNITTVNTLFNLNIQTELEMKEFLEKEVSKFVNIENSEQSALSRVGERLYNLLFKNYTKKQWDKNPSEIDASVLNRIPVRTDFEDRYFTDKYQGMPKEGYTKMFEKMLDSPNIELMLQTDYFDVKDKFSFEKMFFTGPIDRYFDYIVGEKLEYRSLRFEFENLDEEYYQSKTQINYPNNYEFTRITEPKHATGQINDKTTIIKEYPTWEGEGYYPVPSQRNKDLYEKYQTLANDLEKDNIFFVGRLANYKYINMDQAFHTALDLFERLN